MAQKAIPIISVNFTVRTRNLWLI